MNLIKGAAVAALILTVAVPAQAQQRRNHMPMRGADPVNVESALRLREELKLNANQISQLESLRKEIVAQRQREASEMIELRSRVAAGNIAPEEMRQHFESRREAMKQTVTQRREQLEKILTEEQRAQLGRLQVNARMRPREGWSPDNRSRRPIERGARQHGPRPRRSN